MNGLENVKAGDMVVLSEGWCGERLATVDRATPTMIVVGRRKFNRNGRVRGADSWNRTNIRLPRGQEDIDEIRKETTADYLQHLSGEKLRKMSLEALLQMREIYDSASAEQNNGAT